MAKLDLSLTYPGRADAPSSDYPFGRPRDESFDGAADGTPYQETLINDLYGAFSAVLHQGAVVPSDNVETAVASDFMTGLVNIIQRSSTNYWSVNNITTARTGLTLNTGLTQPLVTTISNDGLSIYVGLVTDEVIRQYTMTSYMDLTSATLSGSIDLSATISGIRDIQLCDSNSRLFIVGATDTYVYTLSTPGDITTANLLSSASNITPQMYGLHVSETGLYAVSTRINSETIYTYTLSTAFDLLTAFERRSFSLPTIPATGLHCASSKDGSRLFVSYTDGSAVVNQYDLASPYDVGNDSYAHSPFSGGNSTLNQISFTANGDIMLIVEGTGVIKSVRTSVY